MKPLNDQATCPHCGYDPGKAPQKQAGRLRPGTTLQGGRYVVGNVLGQGGFGITYIGRNLNLQMVVAIKEFYPNGYVARESTGASEVDVVSEKYEAFLKKGKANFLKEARTLAQFQSESAIVGVFDYFEENNTAYIVMEFLEGRDLRACLKEKTFEPGDIFKKMSPVFRALRRIHREDVLHRDISPDNIMMREDGSLVLMDFGAARMANYDSEITLSVMLKPGYAPVEQYARTGNQGPWTDIYALCATIYKCITGKTPMDSLKRSEEVKTATVSIVESSEISPEEQRHLAELNTVEWPSGLGYPITPTQEQVLQRGMALEQSERLQSIEELQRLLEAEKISHPEEPPDPTPENEQKDSASKLFIVYGNQVREALLTGRKTFGRKAKNSDPDLAVASPYVSRVVKGVPHGEFRCNEEGKVFYKNNRNTNSTWINDRKMETDESCELTDGDVLKVHAEGQPVEGDAYLFYCKDWIADAEWRFLNLSDEIRVITAGYVSDLLQTIEGQPQRETASIFWSQGQWNLMNHGCNEGVFVNGESVFVKKLNHGDCIKINGYYFLLFNQYLLYQTAEGAPYINEIRNHVEKPEESRSEAYDKWFVRPSMVGYGNGNPAESEETRKDLFTITLLENDVWNRFKNRTILKSLPFSLEEGVTAAIGFGTHGLSKTTLLNAAKQFMDQADYIKRFIMAGSPEMGDGAYEDEEEEKTMYGNMKTIGVAYSEEEQENHSLKRALAELYDEICLVVNRKDDRSGLMTSDRPVREHLEERIRYAKNAGALLSEEERRNSEKETMELLQAFHLQNVEDVPLRDLDSYGQLRFRTALACICKPDLLIMDGPDDDLYRSDSNELLALLQQHARRTGMKMFVMPLLPDIHPDSTDHVMVLKKLDANTVAQAAYGDPWDILDQWKVRSFEELEKILRQPVGIRLEQPSPDIDVRMYDDVGMQARQPYDPGMQAQQSSYSADVQPPYDVGMSQQQPYDTGVRPQQQPPQGIGMRAQQPLYGAGAQVQQQSYPAAGQRLQPDGATEFDDSSSVNYSHNSASYTQATEFEENATEYDETSVV